MRVTPNSLGLTNLWPSGSRSKWNLEMLVFEERGKPEYPEKNLSEQRREPKTNSTHIWHQDRESNPGHIGGRRALSPLPIPAPLATKSGLKHWSWWTFSRSLVTWYTFISYLLLSLSFLPFLFFYQAMKEEQADIQRAADEQQPTYPAVGEWGGTAEPPTVGEVSINYSQKCHFILLEAFTVAPQYNSAKGLGKRVCYCRGSLYRISAKNIKDFIYWGLANNYFVVNIKKSSVRTTQQ